MQTVVIADDDPLLVKLLEHKLGTRGYEVLCVEDGEAAVQSAMENRPDVIVLDGMMPGLDGFEVLRQLKERPETKPIPVVMLTARKQERDILTGLSLGAADYLVKPFSPEELVTRVQKVLAPTVAQSQAG